MRIGTWLCGCLLLLGACKTASPGSETGGSSSSTGSDGTTPSFDDPYYNDCASDEDCDFWNPACVPETGWCVKCTSSEHCAFTLTPACDTATNTCVECLSSEHFDFLDPACNVETMTCVECLADADCDGVGAAGGCDVAKHECVPCLPARCDGICDGSACVECTDNSGCDAGEACSFGRCRERCASDDDCATTAFCDYDDMCTLRVGAPCDPGAPGLFECGQAGLCADVDANLTKVDIPYCTQTCSPNSCPDGYVCQGTCRKVAGE